MIECPYCGKELILYDWFGTQMFTSSLQKMGDIYKCENQECESGIFNYYFYTYDENYGLHEGYPC